MMGAALELQLQARPSCPPNGDAGWRALASGSATAAPTASWHWPPTGNRGRLELLPRSDPRWRIAIAVHRDLTHRPARSLPRSCPARVSLGTRWRTSLQDQPKQSRSCRQPRTATANTDPNGRDRVRHDLTSRSCLPLFDLNWREALETIRPLPRPASSLLRAEFVSSRFGFAWLPATDWCGGRRAGAPIDSAAEIHGFPLGLHGPVPLWPTADQQPDPKMVAAFSQNTG